MLLGSHSLKKVERHFIRESNILNNNGFNGADYHKTNFIGFHVFGSYISNDADQGSIVLRLSKDEEFLFKSGPSVENSTLSITRSNNIIVSGQAPECLNWCIINREKLAQQYNISPKSLESSLIITISDFGIDTGQWLSILVKN
jgi:hypothetical protein